MKIGIVGGGSIGLLISSYLCTKHEVTIYVKRNEQKQKLNDQGLFLSHSSIPFSVRAMLIDEMKKEECLIICVKQTQITSVLTKIITFNKQTPLLFLQNGMGHIDVIKKLNQPIYIGVVEHGALRVADDQVVHLGRGKIKLANYKGEKVQLEYFVDQFNQQHFPVESSSDWCRLLSEKLIINAVINPLTALFVVKNSEVIQNPYIYKIAEMLCQETALVLKLDFHEQWKRVQTIAEHTGENTSSMLKDISQNQLTEIEAISGYVLNNSKGNIPYTSFVYNSVKALEKMKGITR